MNTIYLIKARVKVTGQQFNEIYKPLSLKGLFVPKTKKRTKAYIEEEFRKKTLTRIQKENPDLLFEVSNIKIETFSHDFVINEKSQS